MALWSALPGLENKLDLGARNKTQNKLRHRKKDKRAIELP
jgi:hypothetical protein